MNHSKGYLIPAYAIILLGFLMSGLFGSRIITVISENAPIQSGHCFIIDAGHGGVDGGAVSCTGVYESQINLQIALRLNDLMHLLGLNTKMIRSTDISVYTSGESRAAKKSSDLKERVRIVNETDHAINSVSIKTSILTVIITVRKCFIRRHRAARSWPWRCSQVLFKL